MLPAQFSLTPASAGSPTGEPLPPPSVHPARGKTVLLVEHHEDSRYISSAILGYHGYDTVEADDGATGVRLAERHRPDLVVLDIVLPVLDGWAAAQRIRDSDATAGIPIVALTSLAFRADRERGRRMGFAAYLVKPCSPSRMVSVVRRLIGPAGPPRRATLPPPVRG